MAFRKGQGARPNRTIVHYSDDERAVLLTFIAYVREETGVTMPEGRALYALFIRGMEAWMRAHRRGLACDARVRDEAEASPA